MDKIYNVYIEFNDDDPNVFPQDIGYFSTEEKAKQAVEKAKEIAAELFFSENTIKKDLTSIYQKLDVHDKSELIVKYKDLF